MMRPCTCDRTNKEPWADYTPDQCRLCWLYHHDIDYQESWSGTGASPEMLACRHRGPATGATVDCPSCAGTVSLKLFRCALFGTCTLAKQVAGIACCATCSQRSTASVGA